MSNHFTKPFNPLEWQASPHDFGSDNLLGIYAPDTTQRYVYGTRYLTWDGRVFKYFNAGAAITTSHVDYALYFAGGHRSAWYLTFANTHKVGDKSVIVTFATSDITTCAEDELAGGTMVMYKSGIANQQVRQIVGNTKDISSVVTVYLEAPLATVLTASVDAYEVLANPWANLQSSFATNSQTTSMAGMPVTPVVSGSKSWVQTWGIARGSWTEPAGAERSLYYMANGSFAHRGDVASGTDQRVGVCILPGTEHSAFFMLQCSI